MTGILDEKMAKRAFDLIRPVILGMMERREVKRPALHLLLLNPLAVYGITPIGEAILYAEDFGVHRSEWERNYEDFAREKALISWRTGMTSRKVVELHPELLLPGDVLYAGSATYHGNIIAAASGVDSHHDEMFAGLLVATAHGLVMEQMEAIKADRRNRPRL